MVKAVLLDFDGTLVRENVLAIACEIAGKREECLRIDNDFHLGKTSGVGPLIDMINLLRGISLNQIERKLRGIPQSEYLMPGADELLIYLRSHGIISILSSGNILPILDCFRTILQLDYVIGSRPKIKNRVILGIASEDFTNMDFKLFESKAILKSLRIAPSETVAIGDSPGDRSKFTFAGKSIAINPKGGIEKYADYVIQDNLKTAIEIIEEINRQ